MYNILINKQQITIKHLDNSIDFILWMWYTTLNQVISNYHSEGGNIMALTNEDLHAIELLLEPLKRDIKSIHLTLENETNRNIKIIAEGHLDLSRKLDDALKVENEKEMLLIRVNHLENELRKIKERLESIA